ncbi:MAG: phage tail protein [Pseudonocardiaceae bacterium]
MRRYDGTVLVRDQRRRTMAAWEFFVAMPAKLVGPQLNAKTGEIAIEELHLADCPPCAMA